MHRKTSILKKIFLFFSALSLGVLLAVAVFFINFADASPPLGSQSSIGTTTLGRRVVLKWPLPAIYPGLSIGGLVCVASGQAPRAVHLLSNEGEIVESIEIEQVSPLCVHMRSVDILSAEPLRFLVSFDLNDSAQISVFPERGARTERYDFITESDEGSTAVLQLVDYRKTGATHAGVLCTTTLDKVKKVTVSYQDPEAVSPATIPLQARADGCVSMNALNFLLPGKWNLNAVMSSGEVFEFFISSYR